MSLKVLTPNIMFKVTATILLAFVSFACSQKEAAQNVELAMNTSNNPSFYDFSVTDIDGQPFDFSQFKGKRVLIVNVASKCGYTKQYEQLQELYNELGGETFTIIGFPANNFMNQEPGSDEDIKAFCQKNYGVTFPMMSKISVKGKNIHPLYSWLTDKNQNGVDDFKVKWNFHKFLIDENGVLVTDHPSSVSPMSEEIVSFAEGK